MRLGIRVRLGLLAAMLVWAVFSLGHLPPLDGSPSDVEGAPGSLAVLADGLYGFAAVRYLQLWGRRRTPMLLARSSAFILLLGTGGGRTHTVIGDTVNTASRIEGKAPAGGVALGPSTKDRLPGVGRRRWAHSSSRARRRPSRPTS